MSADARRSIQSAAHRRIRAPELFLGSVAALLAAILLVGAAISVSPAASNAAPATAWVNRTGKADRLVSPSRSLRLNSSLNSKLPRGCEPVISPLADIQLARLARQCVS